MTYQITLPETDTVRAWRDAARRLLLGGVPPEEVRWTCGTPETGDLFGDDDLPAQGGVLNVPRAFLDLAKSVAWHRDGERFARLYTCLWRLCRRPGQMSDRADPLVARLNAMAKDVRRDKHKMTAFVRFREVDRTGPRRRFAAWFEPAHYIAEPTAPFFAKRFGDMNWTIFTPHLTVDFSDGELRFSAGCHAAELPGDSTEDLWRTYYRSIFNPARLKVQAMQSEMPKKYWKNLPEAELIPSLIAEATAQVSTMLDTAPTPPSDRAERIKSSHRARKGSE